MHERPARSGTIIDDLHERLDVPAQRIVELLLADCHNLAVPGLVVGFLTRHPKATGNLLDPFLVCPAIWHWRPPASQVTTALGENPTRTN